MYYHVSPKSPAVVCENCGEVVPNPLPDDAKIWHPWVPRSDGEYMASVEGVEVVGMERCESKTL